MSKLLLTRRSAGGVDLVVPSANWDLLSKLPSGMTLYSDNPHTTATPAPWSTTDREASGVPFVVTEASDPTGDSSILRQNWAGVGDGNGPDFLYCNPSGGGLYIASVIRITPQMLPPNEVKWVTFLGGAGDMYGWFGFWRGNSGTGQSLGMPNSSSFYGIGFVYRISGDYHTAQVNAVNLSNLTDEWIKVQMHLDMANDVCDIWINDIQVAQASAAQISDNWGGTTGFGELQLGSTWGGGNGISAPSGAQIDYARTAIYRRV